MRAIRHWWLMLGLLQAAPASAIEFAGKELAAVDRAEACYLIFVRLYQATLYSDAQGQTHCVDLEYLRPFSREDLTRATLALYLERYGEQAATQDAEELQRLVDAYQGVDRGDRYRFCLSPDHGAELARDGTPVMQTTSSDFAQRLLGLWVEGVYSQGRARWSFDTCKRSVF